MSEFETVVAGDSRIVVEDFIVVWSCGGEVLVMTAAQLVNRDDRTRFDYFDSEEKARAWLAQERARLQTVKGAQAPSARSKSERS